eukprot:TRINITY_DN3574_c0_g1_i3.p1 TRINITY_DN3574_c0_g1~~TRINITY_DN3574_c0_g1_i3.p1  ORF type:complete len:634 (-),score=54.94 TRINITY_DN3574_c0_g1_i3:2608-4509(-)
MQFTICSLLQSILYYLFCGLSCKNMKRKQRCRQDQQNQNNSQNTSSAGPEQQQQSSEKKSKKHDNSSPATKMELKSVQKSLRPDFHFVDSTQINSNFSAAYRYPSTATFTEQTSTVEDSTQWQLPSLETQFSDAQFDEDINANSQDQDPSIIANPMYPNRASSKADKRVSMDSKCLKELSRKVSADDPVFMKTTQEGVAHRTKFLNVKSSRTQANTQYRAEKDFIDSIQKQSSSQMYPFSTKTSTKLSRAVHTHKRPKNKTRSIPTPVSIELSDPSIVCPSNVVEDTENFYGDSDDLDKNNETIVSKNSYSHRIISSVTELTFEDDKFNEEKQSDRINLRSTNTEDEFGTQTDENQQYFQGSNKGEELSGIYLMESNDELDAQEDNRSGKENVFQANNENAIPARANDEPTKQEVLQQNFFIQNFYPDESISNSLEAKLMYMFNTHQMITALGKLAYHRKLPFVYLEQTMAYLLLVFRRGNFRAREVTIERVYTMLWIAEKYQSQYRNSVLDVLADYLDVGKFEFGLDENFAQYLQVAMLAEEEYILRRIKYNCSIMDEREFDNCQMVILMHQSRERGDQSEAFRCIMSKVAEDVEFRVQRKMERKGKLQQNEVEKETDENFLGGMSKRGRVH